MGNLLAFDPGHTVGVAAISSVGELVLAMTVPWETVNRLQFFPSLQKLVNPVMVLVENVPPLRPDKITASLQRDIVRWYTVAGIKVVQIDPSWWKPMIKREPLSGTHMTDAYTMARWYLGKEGQDV